MMPITRALTVTCHIVFAGIASVPAQALAQSAGQSAGKAVSVTVYDPSAAPYSAQGYADESGSVIIFDAGRSLTTPTTTSPYAAPTYETGAAPAYGTATYGTGTATPPGIPVINRYPATYQPAVQPLVIAPAGVSMYPYGTPQGTSGGTAAQPAPQYIQAVPASGQLSPTPATAPEPDYQMAAGDGEFVDGIYIINTNYLYSFPENAYRILSSPVYFDQDDWINVGIVLGITGSLLLLDESLNDFWQDDIQNGFTEGMADAFRPLGESKYIIAGTLGAYAIAELLGAEREKATALLAFQSFALTAGLISGIKFITGRERPENSRDDAFDFEGPGKGDFNASFPSGHAGNAFSLATVISEMYKEDNPWVPWIAYPLAGGTALARVDDERHWFSDVFLGGALGYFIGKMVVKYSPFLQRNNMSFVPMNEQGVQGAALQYKF